MNESVIYTTVSSYSLYCLSLLFYFKVYINVFVIFLAQSNKCSLFNKSRESLIILKLPRSGSTWFTEQVNGYDIVRCYRCILIILL